MRRYLRPDDTATSASFEDTSPLIDLGDGLAIHEDTQVHVRQWDHDIDIHIGVIDGRLGAERFEIWRNETSEPITSEALRSLPVATLVRYAARTIRYTGDRNGTEPWTGSAWPSEEEDEHIKIHGLDDTTLRIVARLYRIAYLFGDPPTKKVETMFELSRATAGRWVSAARKAGYLSEARGPGKAGG